MSEPTRFSKKICDEICALIANGASIMKVCERDDMPAWSTVQSWLLGDKDFARAYDIAHQYKADWEFAKIQELEDRMLLPKKISVGYDDKGKEVFRDNPEYLDPNAGRVVIDAMKWRLGKMKPSGYGENKSQSVVVDIGENYSALLSALDERPQIVDITPNGQEEEKAEV